MRWLNFSTSSMAFCGSMRSGPMSVPALGRLHGLALRMRLGLCRRRTTTLERSDFAAQGRDLALEFRHALVVAVLAGAAQLVQALVHAVEFGARGHTQVGADALHLGLHVRTRAHLRVDNVAVDFAEFVGQRD